MIRHDMTLDQGATFATSFTWLDAEGAGIDLTAYTARLQVRATYADEDPGDPIVELTDEAGITLDGEGVIAVALTADETEVIPGGDYVWDLELVDSDVVTRLVGGKLHVTREVTR